MNKHLEFTSSDDDTKGQIVEYAPNNLMVQIGTFVLVAKGPTPGPMFLWDVKTCLADGQPLPPFRSMVIRCDTESVWTVEMEFMPK